MLVTSCHFANPVNLIRCVKIWTLFRGKYRNNARTTYHLAICRCMDCVIGLGRVDEFWIIVVDVEEFHNYLGCCCQSFGGTRIFCCNKEFVDSIHLPIEAHFGGNLTS